MKREGIFSLICQLVCKVNEPFATPGVFCSLITESPFSLLHSGVPALHGTHTVHHSFG